MFRLLNKFNTITLSYISFCFIFIDFMINNGNLLYLGRDCLYDFFKSFSFCKIFSWLQKSKRLPFIRNYTTFTYVHMSSYFVNNLTLSVFCLTLTFITRPRSCVFLLPTLGFSFTDSIFKNLFLVQLLSLTLSYLSFPQDFCREIFLCDP